MLLSVLMPVFNSEKYLELSINSIINQNFKEFEFIIVNDGSTDESEQVIKSFDDSRIIYLKNDVNEGIVATLNKGIDISKGKYIARMDADDIAHPNRFQEQLNFMLANPKVKICGSQAIAINETGKKFSKVRRPLSNDNLKVNNLFRNSFIHPSIIFDSQILKEYKYSSNFQFAEDYYLISQIILKYEVTNLKKSLLNYRIHSESITHQKHVAMNESEKKIMHYILSNFFGEVVSEETVSIHHSFLRRSFKGLSAQKIENHLLKIKRINASKNIYNHTLLEKTLLKEWFNFLRYNDQKGVLLKFIKSDLFSIKYINIKYLLKLAFK